jgi:hypothetical protein
MGVLKAFLLISQIGTVVRAQLFRKWKAFRPKGLDGMEPNGGAMHLTGLLLFGQAHWTHTLHSGGYYFASGRVHLVRWKLVRAGWIDEQGELTPLAMEWVEECLSGMRQDIDRLLLACGDGLD